MSPRDFLSGWSPPRPARQLSAMLRAKEVRFSTEIKSGSGDAAAEVQLARFKSRKARDAWNRQVPGWMNGPWRPVAPGTILKGHRMSGTARAPRTVAVQVLGPDFLVAIYVSSRRRSLTPQETRWAEGLAVKLVRRFQELG